MAESSSDSCYSGTNLPFALQPTAQQCQEVFKQTRRKPRHHRRRKTAGAAAGKGSKRSRVQEKCERVLKNYRATFTNKLQRLEQEFRADTQDHVWHVRHFQACGRSRADRAVFAAYKKLFIKSREDEARRTQSALLVLKRALMESIYFETRSKPVDTQLLFNELGLRIDEEWEEFELSKIRYFEGPAGDRMLHPAPDQEHREALCSLQSHLYQLFSNEGEHDPEKEDDEDDAEASSDLSDSEGSDTAEEWGPGAARSDVDSVSLSSGTSLFSTEEDSPVFEEDIRECTLGWMEPRQEPSHAKLASKSTSTGGGALPLESDSNVKLPESRSPIGSAAEPNPMTDSSKPRTDSPEPASKEESPDLLSKTKRSILASQTEPPGSVAKDTSQRSQQGLPSSKSSAEPRPSTSKARSDSDTDGTISAPETTELLRSLSLDLESKSGIPSETAERPEPGQESPDPPLKIELPKFETDSSESTTTNTPETTKPDLGQTPSDIGESHAESRRPKNSGRLDRATRKMILQMLPTHHRAGGRQSERTKPRATSTESGESSADTVVPMTRSPSPVLEVEVAQPWPAQGGEGEQPGTERTADVHAQAEDVQAQVQAQAQDVQTQTEDVQTQTEDVQAQAQDVQTQTEDVQAQAQDVQALDVHAQAQEVQPQAEDVQAQAADGRGQNSTGNNGLEMRERGEKARTINNPRTEAQQDNPQTGAQPDNPQTGAQPDNPQTGAQLDNPQTGAQPDNPQTGAQPDNPQTGDPTDPEMEPLPDNPETGAQPDNTQMEAHPGDAKMEAHPDDAKMEAHPDDAKMEEHPDDAKMEAHPGRPQTAASADSLKVDAGSCPSRTPEKDSIKVDAGSCPSRTPEKDSLKVDAGSCPSRTPEKDQQKRRSGTYDQDPPVFSPSKKAKTTD